MREVFGHGQRFVGGGLFRRIWLTDSYSRFLRGLFAVFRENTRELMKRFSQSFVDRLGKYILTQYIWRVISRKINYGSWKKNLCIPDKKNIKYENMKILGT